MCSLNDVQLLNILFFLIQIDGIMKGNNFRFCVQLRNYITINVGHWTSKSLFNHFFEGEKLIS
jgi:phosphoribosylformimino-5-aminoimidazole carboxamide ribonucleotide (ProFAR) isomerase